MTDLTTVLVINKIVAPSIFALIVLFGFSGNLLVIIVVSINKQLRNCTNILIASLAIADITFITFCVPLTATIYIKSGWILDNISCKVYMYLTYLTAYMSVYTLVLMSVDRYLAVVHPIASIIVRTERNAVKIVITTWVVFMICNSPLLFNSGVVYPVPEVNETRDYYCTYLPNVRYNLTADGYEENFQFGRLYTLLFFIFGYLLPLLAIVFLYVFLIWKLLFNRHSRISQSNKALQSKKRVTRMVVVVVTVFALCWLPIQIVFLIQHFGSEPDNAAFRAFHVLGNALAYSNSMMNPILYAFFSNNFRLAFKSVLCCQKQSFSGQEFEKTHVNVNRHISETQLTKNLKGSQNNAERKFLNDKNNRPLPGPQYLDLNNIKTDN